MKNIVFTILILSFLNSAYAQYEITAIPLPEKINLNHSKEFVFPQAPMISPDGNTLIYSMNKKATGFGLTFLQSNRNGTSWSESIEILNNLSEKKVLVGYNGNSLFFRIDSTIYKSNFVSGSFKLALPYKFPKNVNYTYDSKYLFTIHHYYLGNPHKMFYENYPDNQRVYEYYFSNSETTLPLELPKNIIGKSPRSKIAIGNNGILFKKRKKNSKYASEPFISLSIKDRNTWSSPFKIVISNFNKKEIQKIRITSYSEETHEIFFEMGVKIYSAKLPDEIIKLINTDYPSENPIAQSPTTTAEPIIEETVKPKYYALLIGIEDYQNNQANLVDLNQPINDAISLKSELLEHYTFDEQNITILKNPNRSDIINSFERLSNLLTEKDNLLIFYAGHGVWDEKLNIGYWLSSDVSIESKANWISNSTIRDYIGGMKTKHTLLISDACFSGSIFKSREVGKSIDDYGYYRLNKLQSRKAMTSGTLNTVPDDSKFMKYLLKALASNEKEYFPSKQLFHEIEIAIINNTTNIPQFGTIQNTGDEGGDFIFIKKESD